MLPLNMLQLGLPEKLHQQAARFHHSECFEMYSSVCVGIYPGLTDQTKDISSNGGAWQHLAVWHLASCPLVVQYAWKHVNVQVGAPKRMQGSGVPQAQLSCGFVERGRVVNVASTSEPHCWAGCGEMERKYGSEHTRPGYRFFPTNGIRGVGCCVACVYARTCFYSVRAIPKVRCHLAGSNRITGSPGTSEVGDSVSGTLQATCRLGSDKDSFPCSPLCIYSLARDAFIAKKLPIKNAFSQ